MFLLSCNLVLLNIRHHIYTAKFLRLYYCNDTESQCIPGSCPYLTKQKIILRNCSAFRIKSYPYNILHPNATIQQIQKPLSCFIILCKQPKLLCGSAYTFQYPSHKEFFPSYIIKPSTSSGGYPSSTPISCGNCCFFAYIGYICCETWSIPAPSADPYSPNDASISAPPLAVKTAPAILFDRSATTPTHFFRPNRKMKNCFYPIFHIIFYNVCCQSETD